jgi:hypothetical protein
MGGGGVHVGWQSGGGTRRRSKYRWTGDLAIANALLAMDEMDGWMFSISFSFLVLRAISVYTLA